MAKLDVAKLLERIRSFGANVTLDGSKLIIVNRDKLPEGAAKFVRENGRAVADWLASEADFNERSAIMEHDGGLTRQGADYITRMLMANPPAGSDAADWSWYCDQAARLVDGHLARAA